MTTSYETTPTAWPASRVMANRIVRKFLAVSAGFLLGTAVHAQATSCSYELPAPLPPDAAALESSATEPQYLRIAYGMFTNYPAVRQAAEGTPMLLGPDEMYMLAKKLFERDEASEAWPLAERAAECGNREAVLLLIEQSLASGRQADAHKYLGQGVNMDMPRAEYLLAEQYDKGKNGFNQDRAIAFKWYYKAAKAKLPEAMVAVAYYFVRGYNGVKDDLAAIHWYHEAAKAGSSDGMTAYGWMALNKTDLPQNEKSDGQHWLKKAASNGDEDARRFLAVSLKAVEDQDHVR